MRIPTLRSLALAAILIIFDFREFLYIGDAGFNAVRYEGFAGWLMIISGISGIGLVFVLACSVLLTDKAPSFVRPAVLCAAMLLIEVIQFFGLAPPEILFWLLLFLLFLRALLILFVLEAVAQLSRIFGDAETAVIPERVGLLYALTFPLRVGSIFWADFRGIFWLVGMCIAVLTSGILFYMYTKVRLPSETVVDTEPPELDGEPGAGDGAPNAETETQDPPLAQDIAQDIAQDLPEDLPQNVPEAEEA